MTDHPWIHRLAPWIAPIFVFLWSTGFIIARYSMPYAEPMTVIFIRFASVVLCMLPVVLIWRAPWPNRSQIIHIAIAGALLQAGYVGGVWAAVKEGMSAGLTALIVGLQPILTAWFAAWIAEKVTPKQWLGLILGLLGVGLVVWAKLSLTGMSHLSLVFIVIALLSITMGTLYQKKYCAQFDLRTGSVIQFAASAIICLPLMFLFETREIIWAPELILSLIWAVLALSIGAISLLFVMIRNGEATRVTSLMYLTPPTTAIMAWLLFNEPITWTIILGIAITMSAVILVNRTTSK
ncbi:DMT family transporter [Polynucleobacter victoriensis]|uniref:Permease of the drug/metabolite transporter (DMT) superfamily n=1 Tax=Polynucleobacter victoriensis TaxID=2049319 RepID=A0A212U029_9BURK|nr:DMT family transporter [Polynucleobacter victoriensis]SNC71579.1 Permease of the drug/metabolite transporter (DMT) superfamily [Polynucleobacter victoriensis]